MNNKWLSYLFSVGLATAMACTEDKADPSTPSGNLPSTPSVSCKVEEIEFRNGDDHILSIREFAYNVNRGNRMEWISIIEDIGVDVLNLRFQLRYHDDNSRVPYKIDEIFGGDIITSIDFKYDPSGNLTEFTQFQVYTPSIPPESHVFVFEPSILADDSINTRIIIFDIERMTQDWIDVLPANFTTGGQRITRFNKISFRGDLLEFCEFIYNENGFLEEIQCRNFDQILTEMWNFTYQNNELISAYHQLPNFRALTEYEYDRDGKPESVISTTDGRFNWKGRYFYLCR